jgi:hypothetical protein
LLAAPPKRPWKVHPIWRGIGCIIMLVAPVIAYAGATVLIDLNAENDWVTIPYELMQPVRIASLDMTVDRLYGTLILAGLLLILGFALIISIYGVIYGLMGPPRYGPLDADPNKDIPRRRRR